MTSPTGTIREVDINPIQIKATNATDFTPDGLVVAKPSAILATLGYTNVSAILDKLPAIRRGGVQSAAVGVIQDPAGSAIGTGCHPSGGGASGAIYGKFLDLQPIDNMAPRSAIFNRSTGAGRRVLHTHSPILDGKPTSEGARSRVLEDLSNCYYNALVAVNERSAALDKDGALLNLVPVSASIFARAFRRNHYDAPHLDPSYTLTAIMVAIGEMLKGNQIVVDLALYYFSADVYQDAVKLVERLEASRS